MGFAFVFGHHSLVTPIDWKLAVQPSKPMPTTIRSHHSLVTPIDWKLDQPLHGGLQQLRGFMSPLAGDTY